MKVSDFIHDEDGAITADWTVLTGLLVGLGLAATAVLTTGLEVASGNIAGELSAIEIVERLAETVFFDDFENGAAGWVGGVVDASQAAYGSVLGPFGGSDGAQAVRRVFDLAPGYDYAVMGFDVHAIDSWDNEAFMIFANDEHVATANFQHGTNGLSGSWVTDNPDVTIAMTPTSPRAHAAYDAGWTDQSVQMQVAIRNPGDQIAFGFGSTLDQSIEDESWAIDNVTVTSTNSLGD